MQRISFMTLGCPDWDLDSICTHGPAFGFDGVDFRGYLDQIDITLLPEFTTRSGETSRKLQNAGLAVSGISSGIQVCVPDDMDKNLEEARRTIAVAKTLDSVNIRIFGGGDLNNYPREELAKFGCDCIARLLQLDGANDLNWLFETHDNWVQAEQCRLLLDSIPDPAFGTLWDMGHTWRVGREKPANSWDAIGSRVGCTHIKDAVYDPESSLAMEDGWYYVAPGTGELPLDESLSLLKEFGYNGWLVFEHEKRWHPNLPDPELIFPQFESWIRKRFPKTD